MKKIVSVLLTAFMSLQMIISVYADDEIKVYFNDRQLIFDQPPIMENDRVLVPMRAIFEAFGATVEWDEAAQTVHSSLIGDGFSHYMHLPVGSTTAIIDNEERYLDVPAKIVNNRTLVPVRFISEALYGEVDWEDDTQTVNIYGHPVNGFGYSFLYNDTKKFMGYRGNYANGRFNGEGTLYTSDGTIQCEGTFEDGKFVRGTYYRMDGGKYVGEFKNAIPDGQCTLYDADGNIVYSGTFKDGEYIPDKNPRLDEYNQNLSALNEAYQKRLQTIDVFINDPINHQWGREVMAEYEKMADDYGYTEELASSKNTDSFSRANAIRQREAILSQGKQVIYNTYLNIAETERQKAKAQYDNALERLNTDYADVLSGSNPNKTQTSSIVYYKEVPWCPDFGYYSGYSFITKNIRNEGGIYAYSLVNTENSNAILDYGNMIMSLGFVYDESQSSDYNSTGIGTSVFSKGHYLISIYFDAETPDTVFIIARTI